MNRNKQQGLLHFLEKEATEPVRDPLWKHIYLFKPFLRIFEEAPVQKLGGIKQLGPTHLVYPGATHTRLNHSLGVYHLAKRIMHQFIPYPIGAELTQEGLTAFLCAALLHDLGHYPFAHSLKELPVSDHEELTGKIIRETSLYRLIREEAKTDPEMVAAIVDETLPDQGSTEVRFYRQILSGVLDPDKLDYLNRDAYFCGVPYGIQDVDFIIGQLEPSRESGMVLKAKGLPAVENILFSKYLMYRTIYWHKTVRIATAMIKKAVYSALTEGVIKEQDLYGLDDQEFYTAFSPSKYSVFSLIHNVKARRLYKCVAEIDYSEENPTHRRLSGLKERTKEEARIAEHISAEIGVKVGPEEVILDIPEPISLEIDLSVAYDRQIIPYPDSGTVFKKPVVDGFTKVLRKIRLIVSGKAAGKLDKPGRFLSWDK